MTVPASSIQFKVPRRARLAAAPGALLTVLLGGAAVLAGGCSSPLSTTRTADVFIASDDGHALAGAVVRADPVDPHHPLNIGDYFRDEPAKLGVWRTGQDGHAQIVLLSDRPTTLFFLAPGYEPSSRQIRESEHPPFTLTLHPLTAGTP